MDYLSLQSDTLYEPRLLTLSTFYGGFPQPPGTRTETALYDIIDDGDLTTLTSSRGLQAGEEVKTVQVRACSNKG